MTKHENLACDPEFYTRLKALCEYAGVDISNAKRVEITVGIFSPVEICVEYIGCRGNQMKVATVGMSLLQTSQDGDAENLE